MYLPYPKPVAQGEELVTYELNLESPGVRDALGLPPLKK